jgi:hypothetical protein
MNTHTRRSAPSNDGSRRGVLLLVVLSMLTLFMMLGAAYLVVATRSRETAKSFARLSLRSDNVRLPHSQVFDTVMLRVLRGGASPLGRTLRFNAALPNPGITPVFESLLADKYGYDTLQADAVPSPSEGGNFAVYEQPPLLTIPAVYLTTAPTLPFAAPDLNGRIVTILGPGREPSSHRILRATENADKSFRLQVDNQPRNRPYQPVPVGTTCKLLINGREFTGDGTPSAPHEPWDGFDDQNPFLAHIAPADGSPDHAPLERSISSSVVKKAGYVQSGTTPAVLDKLTGVDPSGFAYGADNDNDGKQDGFYVDFGLPTVIAPNGDRVLLQASVLVVDLDGRINVNAHGSLAQTIYPSTATSGTHALWPSGASVPAPGGVFSSLPLGSGYGPPEINIDRLFLDNDVLYPPKYFDRATPLATANGRPIENPAAYIRTGVTHTRMNGNDGDKAGGRYGVGSRFFSIDASGAFSVTPQTVKIEGRYGNPAAAFWAPQTQFTSDQCRIGIDKARSFPLVRPGRPFENDLISAVNDHRSQANSASQAADALRTVDNEGVPPLWWNAEDGDTFNWAKTTSIAGTIPKPRAVYNSPPDLHGRMKTVSVAANGSSVVPRVAYAKAEWSRNDAADVETRDDPYEIRLDTRAPRNSWLNSATALTNPNGNLFNLSELENTLRPYDIDSAKLPPRLEALLGSFCEESRLRITTDSWDTTVVTGSAAKYVTDSQRTLWNSVGGDPKEFYSSIGTANGDRPFTGLMGREIARGERFDLNRPLTAKKPAGGYKATDPYYLQRQAYFQDLYLLLFLLSNETNGSGKGVTGGFDHAKCAQWAANVVEFRDADSTMTPFEYDADPSNGWQVDGDASKVDAGVPDRKLVFGTERPEVVITETSAWEDDTTGELFVMLHRPWNAKAYATPGAGQAPVSITAEPVDGALDAYKDNDPANPAKGPLDAVDLGRKSGGTLVNSLDPNVCPVWRLRIVADGQTSYVRLDTNTPATNELTPSGITVTSTPRIAADGWLCLHGTNTLPVDIDAAATKVTLGSFRVPGTARAPGQPRDATVYLERLTDPAANVKRGDNSWNVDPLADPSTLTTAQLTGMAIYRVVDQTTVQVVNRIPVAPGAPPAPPSKTTRVASGATAFWKSDFLPGAVPAPSIKLGPLTPGAAPNDNPVWFHWPNRPLNGSPELLLVHRLDSANALKEYTKPSLAPVAADDNYLPGLLKTLANPPLFDAVTVPTRFAGIHGTTADPAKNLERLAGIDQVTTPVNQLSAYREPGRVNLNTVVADDVWNAVVAGSLAKDKGEPDGPVKTRIDDPASSPANNGAKFSSKPAESMQAILALSGTATTTSMPIKDTNAALTEAQKYNPLHDTYTATRLANTATTRSHLFGVWITLREAVAPATSSTPGDPDSVRYHRAFYIVDRSIPVAHDPGRDHNVWDAVLLRRVIE